MSVFLSFEAFFTAILLVVFSSVTLWSNIGKMPAKLILGLKFVLGYVYGTLVFRHLLVDVTVNAFIAKLALPIAILLILEFVFVRQIFNEPRRSWEEEETQKKSVKELAPFAAALLILFVLGKTFVYPIFLTDEKVEVANVERAEKPLEATDEEHLPVVRDGYAKYTAKKKFSEWKKNISYFELGDGEKITVEETLYYVFPIEYRGFFKWIKGQATPGFILVNAENPKADAKMVEQEMNYVPTGYFSDNAKRIVRDAFPSVVLMKETFEVTEEGLGVYVYPYGSYKGFRQIREIEGVIVLDPTTKKMDQYTMDEIPEYIDQVIPTDVASERLEWYGKYREGGFFNALFTQTGVLDVTRWGDSDGVVGLFDKQGKMQWFTDYTNATGDSDSMVAFATLESRTGKVLFYESVSGLSGTDAKSVSSKGQLNAEELSGNVSGLFNIYGQPTWLVSLEDSNGVYRYTALVSAKDEQVYAYAKEKSEALSNYAVAIANGMNERDTNATNIAELTNLKGEVVVVYKKENKEKTVVSFMLKGSEKIYNVSTTVDERVIFIEAGHVIEIKYIDTNQKNVSVKEMNNATLDALIYQ